MIMAALTVGLAGCRETEENDMGTGVKLITAEQAKEIMDQNQECVILDVRDKNEYNDGHIAGAILIPYTEIQNKAEKILPDKDQLILVYCRSGRRSAIAAESLAAMGYTNVKDFGGILDWPYEIVE